MHFLPLRSGGGGGGEEGGEEEEKEGEEESDHLIVERHMQTGRHCTVWMRSVCGTVRGVVWV